MSRARPLTDEEIRILRAVAAGRMSVSPAGRYVIAGEPRPDRKAREAIQRRGYITWPGMDGRSRLTPDGHAAHAALDARP